MNKKIRTIIVDDELEARKGLEVLLEKDREIDVIAVCKNGIEAIEKINQSNPDLLLLDIQMPEVNGFDVLTNLAEDISPTIIFVTAYDQYALNAFKVNAIDYILKPFSDEKFYNSIARAKQLITNKQFAEINSKVDVLIEYYQKEAPDSFNKKKLIGLEIPEKLVIKVDKKIKFIEFSDIVYFEAYDYMLKIHTEDTIEVVRESLSRMLDKLPPEKFVQIHRSYIINIKYLKVLEPHFNNDYIAVLQNGLKLKISRSFKSKLNNLL